MNKECSRCGLLIAPYERNAICNDCRDQYYYVPESPRGWGLVRWIGTIILCAISIVIALVVL